ncbi:MULTISPECIES: site-specific integrase [Thermoactinomyces]|uniref:Site-specific integrase n=1 Tax=Thermoactinomyces daqus TaxID=1329516 RepID=A0A7W2AIP5_9BACL|nr:MULTISPECIES: site-specific integrase [Thermoactinomyces]MBA4543961.1 site-specific integrase [Thermoactinomyces daqus]MBH8599105.1 site-specific integrase [Thermoactinomyces sp. CICC 10523]MBH8607963.1 site-specific integrase [Thermoactinomyces sp. CICC 10521]
MKGHVRKRGSKWCFVLDIGQDPQTGKRKQKWFSGFKTKKEAEKALIQKIHELEQGTFVEPAKTTLKEYMERWLEDYAKTALRPSTLQTYKTYINAHIIPTLGAITLQQLQPMHLQRFYNEKLTNGRVDGEGGLSPHTVRYLHVILKEALGHAVKWQLLSRNVADLADPPALGKKDIITLEPEEVTLFLDHARKDRLYIAFLLAITTGLRRGEILGLRWKDINFEAKTASIRKNLVVVNGKPVLQEPKTKGSIRSVSLPSTTIEELKKHKRIQNQEKLLAGAGYQDNDLIVATSVGTPVSPRNLLRSFYRIIKKANLPDIRFHDLRHTHATLMLKQGEHPKIVSERLGHSNTRITMDIYSHVLPNMQQEAVDRFEKMFLENSKISKVNRH